MPQSIEPRYYALTVYAVDLDAALADAASHGWGVFSNERFTTTRFDGGRYVGTEAAHRLVLTK